MMFVEEFRRPPAQRIVLLCDWLPPDFGAVGQYTLLRAQELAAAGHQVTVVGFSSTVAPAAAVSPPGQPVVTRVHRPAYDKTRLLRRALWTLGANVRLLRAARVAMRQADEVIFTGSPPYLLHFIAPANLWRRRPLVYRITDFHPECLIAEYGPQVPLWLRALRRLTLFWRRRVGRFEVLGEDQAQRLRAQGFSDAQIRLVRDPSPVAIAPDTLPLERPAALVGRRVLLYSGNYGVAHEVDTVIAALTEAERRWPGQVGLWLNAVGKNADRVEAGLRVAGVCVHRSQPVPLAELPALLLAADAHLITLRDAFVGYVLPSKVYACVATGLPLLFVGSAASDVHRVASLGLPAARYRRAAVGAVDACVAGIAAVLGLPSDIAQPGETA